MAAFLGHGWQVVVLRNVSTRSCFMFGYAALRALDGSKRALAVEVRQGGGDYTFPDVRPAPVRVLPGAAASFAIGSLSNPGAEPPEDVCVEPKALSVTPPGQRESLLLDEPVGFYCRGWIVASPLVAGDGGVRY